MKLISALAVIVALAGPASAAVELRKLGWQLAAPAKRGEARRPQSIESLTAPKPGRNVVGRLSGVVTLGNAGKSVEGILMRYAVSAKIQPKDGGEAVWGVPYMLEQRRVPKVRADAALDVPLDAAVWTDLYFKKLAREGYRAVELKMQVMLEPRPGDREPIRVLESALPVVEPAP